MDHDEPDNQTVGNEMWKIIGNKQHGSLVSRCQVCDESVFAIVVFDNRATRFCRQHLDGRLDAADWLPVIEPDDVIFI